MYSLTNLAIATLAGLTLASAAAYAQTASQGQPNCGIETWSTADQKYVTMPCVGGGQAVAGPSTGASAASSNCGIETWSTADQKYVSMPCVGGVTYENPAGNSSENPNNK